MFLLSDSNKIGNKWVTTKSYNKWKFKLTLFWPFPETTLWGKVIQSINYKGIKLYIPNYPSCVKICSQYLLLFRGVTFKLYSASNARSVCSIPLYFEVECNIVIQYYYNSTVYYPALWISVWIASCCCLVSTIVSSVLIVF